MAAAKRDYAAIAARWQARVLCGEVRLGTYHRQTVERQAKDLAAAEAGIFPYHFDPVRGGKLCAFLEQWRHIKGDRAGELLVLDPWQVWALVVLAGWYRNDDPTARRFRRAQWWLCRGQGKSFLAALIGLYFLAIEAHGAEVLTAATTREQARLVFDVAKWAIRKSPTFARRLGIVAGEHAHTCEAGAFVPCSSESTSKEGANASLVICDELHAHPDRALYDTLLTGCGKRKGSLFLVISTAPTDLASIGFEVWDYGRKILSGAVRDDQEMVLIIAADEGQDPYAESTLRQANPGWGKSVDPEFLLAQARMAQTTPSFRAAYMSRHLGWVRRAGTEYISATAWAACVDPALDEIMSLDGVPAPLPKIFAGADCWVGADLSSRVDLACVSIIARKIIEAQKHYYCKVLHFAPQGAIDASLVSQYVGWAEAGHLIVTPGPTTDLDLIESTILSLCAGLRVHEVAGDPWQAAQMLGHIEDAGYEAVEVPQSYRNLSAAIKELEALVLARRWHVGNDPVLAWMISNVVVKRDRKENALIAKEQRTQKIDGVAAIVTALCRAMLAPDDMSPSITFLS